MKFIKKVPFLDRRVRRSMVSNSGYNWNCSDWPEAGRFFVMTDKKGRTSLPRSFLFSSDNLVTTSRCFSGRFCFYCGKI